MVLGMFCNITKPCDEGSYTLKYVRYIRTCEQFRVKCALWLQSGMRIIFWYKEEIFFSLDDDCPHL